MYFHGKVYQPDNCVFPKLLTTKNSSILNHGNTGTYLRHGNHRTVPTGRQMLWKTEEGRFFGTVKCTEEKKMSRKCQSRTITITVIVRLLLLCDSRLCAWCCVIHVSVRDAVWFTSLCVIFVSCDVCFVLEHQRLKNLRVYYFCGFKLISLKFSGFKLRVSSFCSQIEIY